MFNYSYQFYTHDFTFQEDHNLVFENLHLSIPIIPIQYGCQVNKVIKRKYQ